MGNFHHLYLGLLPTVPGGPKVRHAGRLFQLLCPLFELILSCTIDKNSRLFCTGGYRLVLSDVLGIEVNSMFVPV